MNKQPVQFKLMDGVVRREKPDNSQEMIEERLMKSKTYNLARIERLSKLLERNHLGKKRGRMQKLLSRVSNARSELQFVEGMLGQLRAEKEKNVAK